MSHTKAVQMAGFIFVFISTTQPAYAYLATQELAA